MKSPAPNNNTPVTAVSMAKRTLSPLSFAVDAFAAPDITVSLSPAPLLKNQSTSPIAHQRSLTGGPKNSSEPESSDDDIFGVKSRNLDKLTKNRHEDQIQKLETIPVIPEYLLQSIEGEDLHMFGARAYEVINNP